MDVVGKPAGSRTENQDRTDFAIAGNFPDDVQGSGVFDIPPRPVAMDIVVIRCNALVRRQARAQRKVGLVACGRCVYIQRCQQVPKIVAVLVDRPPQVLEAFAGR